YRIAPGFHRIEPGEVCMAEMTTTEGLQLFFSSGAVAAVADRDVDTGIAGTTVYGLMAQPLRVREGVEAFLARIQLAASFASLTRLDDTPIWINCTQVALVRPALPGEYHPDAKTCLRVGGLTIAVKEPPAQVRLTINAHGGTL